MHVFTVTFDQFIASLLIKSIHFLKKCLHPRINPNVQKQLTETKFIRFQHFFLIYGTISEPVLDFQPQPSVCECPPAHCYRLPVTCSFVFLQSGQCRTKQLLIVTHTSAHIHAQHPDTRSPVPLSVSESVSGSRPLCLCHARFFSHYCFLIGGEGHPYHCGNCWGIYWGGGS